jgi:hypothetical protein
MSHKKKVMGQKIYTRIFLGLVEHIAEEHGEELRRLCLVCAEAVEDCGEGAVDTTSKSPSFLFYLHTEARKRCKKALCES